MVPAYALLLFGALTPDCPYRLTPARAVASTRVVLSGAPPNPRRRVFLLQAARSR